MISSSTIGDFSASPDLNFHFSETQWAWTNIVDTINLGEGFVAEEQLLVRIWMSP